MSYISSQDVHISRMRVVSSFPAASRTHSHRSYYFAKNSVLTIIVILMLAMTGFTLFNLIATPEFLVKKEITSIVDDYYENYFYDSVLKVNNLNTTDVDTDAKSEAIMGKIMGSYVDRGFAQLTLRQLLLYDNRRHFGSSASLSEYCDLDQTRIKIYPESPFNRTAYHVDYTYSCKF